MSPMDPSGRYECAHCRKIFWSKEKLGGHVHAQHPGHHRPLPLFLRASAPLRARRVRSLKRPTDAWPGKP